MLFSDSQYNEKFDGDFQCLEIGNEATAVNSLSSVMRESPFQAALHESAAPDSPCSTDSPSPLLSLMECDLRQPLYPFPPAAIALSNNTKFMLLPPVPTENETKHSTSECNEQQHQLDSTSPKSNKLRCYQPAVQA